MGPTRRQRVTLRRGPRGAIWKRVTVESLTLARYLYLLALGLERLATLKLTLGRPITDMDLYGSMTREDYVVLADIVCPGMTPRFFDRWSSPANEGKLVAALIVTNDWTAIRESWNIDGPKRRGGSIEGDLVLLCQMFGCLPWDLMGRYVDEFLLLCRGVRDAAEEEPPARPDTPLAACALIPGVQVIQ